MIVAWACAAGGALLAVVLEGVLHWLRKPRDAAVAAGAAAAAVTAKTVVIAAAVSQAEAQAPRTQTEVIQSLDQGQF